MQINPDSKPTTLLWFTNDLRLLDNSALTYVSNSSDDNKHRLLCLYCVNEQWFEQDRFGLYSMGKHRWEFLVESLHALNAALQLLGQQLIIAKGKPTEIVSDLLSRYAINTVVSSKTVGYNEKKLWQDVENNHPHLRFVQQESFSLFSESQLPFLLSELPTSFSQFRKRIESEKDHLGYVDVINASLVNQPLNLPSKLHVTLLEKHRFNWPKITKNHHASDDNPIDTHSNSLGFYGGETCGLSHLEQYFFGNAPSHYKETRNALGCEKDEWQLSSKFSPWLANGCLSARYIVKTLSQYEEKNGANDSTYWIIFELLWREYFQWYARKYGRKLFKRAGIQQHAPLASFYPQRFQQWCNGSTPWPLVNACMKQLNQTGFLSNRGRQIVASSLIYELGLDWRCGAAYFEQQLIDYDVAANWGNWQYIAGVGADPRGGRQFNIGKQQQTYDPDGAYIKRWQGEKDISKNIDTVDAADWPISDQ
jgi:deoxyribodipyrimidine photo-lyase